jgi:hypothetical protein
LAGLAHVCPRSEKDSRRRAWMVLPSFPPGVRGIFT